MSYPFSGDTTLPTSAPPGPQAVLQFKCEFALKFSTFFFFFFKIKFLQYPPHVGFIMLIKLLQVQTEFINQSWVK